jgi:hypothetical protein
MGTIFHVPVEFVVPLETLAERYDKLTWHDLEGRPVATPTSRGFNCYIYSNEGRGLGEAAGAPDYQRG